MTTRQALNSLQVRSILVLALAVAPPIVALLATAAEWRQHEREEVAATALRLARHAAAIHDRLIQGSQDLLIGLARRPSASPNRGHDLRNLLDGFSVMPPACSNVGVIGTDGRVVLSAKLQGGPADVANRSFFRRAVETRGFTVGGYEPDQETGRSKVTVGYPVLDGGGRVDRVLFAELDMGWLQELATEAQFPEGTTVSVVDANGTILMHEPDPLRWVGRSALSAPGFRTLLASDHEATAETDSLDGTTRLYGVKPLRADSGRLYVAVGIPKENAVAQVNNILSRTFNGFMLAVVVAVVVVSVGNRLSVVRPLQQLVDTTKRLSDGDLGVRADLGRAPEELSNLGRAFDQMAAALQQREKDVALKTEQLAAQERRFRALIENSTDGIVLVDAEGTVRYASPSTARILGYSPEELVGRPVFENMHYDDCGPQRARLAEAVQAPGALVSARCRFRHKGGEWRWIESVGTNLLADPAVGAIVGNYRDVTLRLEAEEELRRAHDELEQRVEARTAELVEANAALHAEIAHRARVEETLRKLSRAIEQTNDSMFLTDRNGVIEYVNPAFEQMTGFSREEAIGATPRLINSGQHPPRFFRKLWATVLSGETFRAVFTNRTKDGRIYYEDRIITPLRDSQGNVTHFVSTGRDITKSRRTTEALRRLNDRLEHEAARIASALHDEAGQFLTSAHITLADVANGLPASAREQVRAIRRDLEEAEAQLRRLSHELRPRVLEDLGLADALNFLADGVAKRVGIPISVEVLLPTRCGPLVETALYRLVQEGLTNIGKHARATGARVVLAQDGETLRCSVSDNGVGFDVSALSARRAGFGLGLLGIQDRLEAVDGALEIISAPGNGTELRAIVPLESCNADASAAG